MTPFAFADEDGVIRTDRALGEQRELSAVVFAATTVGLEAVLAGIPTLRFQPRGRIALDILPRGIDVPTVEADGLAAALDRLSDPPGVSAERVFAAVDGMARGEFPPRPHDPMMCSYCAYALVCRKDYVGDE